jgi:hypothetical protein
LAQAIRLADLLGIRPKDLEARLRDTGDRLTEKETEKEEEQV